jgi:hypothetical protein
MERETDRGFLCDAVSCTTGTKIALSRPVVYKFLKLYQVARAFVDRPGDATAGKGRAGAAARNLAAARFHVRCASAYDARLMQATPGMGAAKIKPRRMSDK